MDGKVGPLAQVCAFPTQVVARDTAESGRHPASALSRAAGAVPRAQGPPSGERLLLVAAVQTGPGTRAVTGSWCCLSPISAASGEAEKLLPPPSHLSAPIK